MEDTYKCILAVLMASSKPSFASSSCKRDLESHAPHLSLQIARLETCCVHFSRPLIISILHHSADQAVGTAVSGFRESWIDLAEIWPEAGELLAAIAKRVRIGQCLM